MELGGRGKRILIVDDEPNIVTSLEFLMETNGYAVRIARDGEDALEQVEEFSPDLILLDVMMPLLNGFEVCQRVREKAAWRHIKIVMLTAKGRDTEATKGLALGADAYITKPFSNKEMVAKVRSLLGDD
jgi:DNA-binding response OmpR family regulator